MDALACVSAPAVHSTPIRVYALFGYCTCVHTTPADTAGVEAQLHRMGNAAIRLREPGFSCHVLSPRVRCAPAHRRYCIRAVCMCILYMCILHTCVTLTKRHRPGIAKNDNGTNKITNNPTMQPPNSQQTQPKPIHLSSHTPHCIHVQDAELQNVTAVNIFTLEESGVIAVEGNTGAPSTGYSPTSRSDEALPPLVPLPSGGVPVLGPSDEWWATVREVWPPDAWIHAYHL